MLRGHEDQDAVARLPVVHLLQDHPDLDGLAEVDLVGQGRGAVQQRTVGGVDLVFEQLDLGVVGIEPPIKW